MKESHKSQTAKPEQDSFKEKLKYVYSNINVEVIAMGNITLALPKEVHEEMKRFSEVKWSEVARKAITQRLETLRMAERLAGKSKLTESDVEQFSKKIKSLATKRFLG